jgi:hypothetical protein
MAPQVVEDYPVAMKFTVVSLNALGLEHRTEQLDVALAIELAEGDRSRNELLYLEDEAGNKVGLDEVKSRSADV